MTDIRTGGLVRETLVASLGEARAGGVVREALVSGTSTATHLRLAGLAREVLLPGGTGPQQYAVSVVT
jgi:hypothetical protein